jgi:crotonobetainyl-CoA:carnitine CoA-transferase CaiB-like acyl-CoA transferase
VGTCLFDVALHQLGYTALWSLNAGHVPARQRRSAHFSVAPVQTVPTADGWRFIMSLTPEFRDSMLGILGRGDLNANPIRINGERLLQTTCSAIGADTEALVGHLGHTST